MDRNQHALRPSFGKRDWLAVLGLLVVTALIYHKGWLHGSVAFSGDIAECYAPYYHYASERLADFSVPFWNPYLSGGFPFLANPGTGAFYPPTWINLLLPVQYAIYVLNVSHLVLAGLLTYTFCRLTLQVGPFAALCGATVFAHAGFMPARYGHPALLMSAAWLPGVLLAFTQGCQRGEVRWFVACGLMLAAALLAGGMQIVYPIGIALGALAIYELLRPATLNTQSGILRPAAANRLAPLLWLPGAIVVAALAGAAQLVPPLEFLPQSSREGGVSFEYATTFSVPPLHGLIMLVSPHFFGTTGTSYWGVWNQIETMTYVGMLPLVLAPAAVASCFRRRYVALLAILAVLAFLLACGRYSPVYRLAYQFVPGIGHLRAPGRFLLLFSFSMAALTAVGIHQLVGGRAGRRWAWWFLAMALVWAALCTSALSFLARDDFVPDLAKQLGMPSKDRDVVRIAMQIVELGGPSGSARGYFFREFLRSGLVLGAALLSVVFLKAAARPTRFASALVLAVLAIDALGYSRGLVAWEQAGTGQNLLRQPDWVAFMQQRDGLFRCRYPESRPSNVQVLDHVRTAEGYGGYLNQRRYVRMLHARDRLNAHERWRRLFGVAYLAGKADELLGDTIAFRSGEDPGNPIVVFHDREALARLRLVFDAEWVSDESAALARVLDPDFDPATAVVIEESPPEGRAVGEAGNNEVAIDDTRSGASNRPPADGKGSAGDSGLPAGPGQVTLLVDEPERLVCSVESPRPGFLVVGDAFYPAWRAMVSGEPTPILRANYLFRAVPVPAGQSEVEMCYVNRPVQFGIWMSLATWLAALAWLGWRTKGMQNPQ